MHPIDKGPSLAALFGMVLVACGGGGGATGSNGNPPPAPGASPTDADRIAAATATAQNQALCTAIRPFYWEVGDKTAAMASGSVGGAGFTATTPVPVASASKWVYAAYVVQRRAGVPDVNDVEFLTLRSGYNNLAPLSCTSSATVDTCLALGTNGALTPQNVGKFYYDGGHMQRHAHDFGLGGFNSAALTAEVAATIGNFGLVYNQPQPAGGLFGSAADYAAFLRRMLAGSLQMSGLLGSHAVCTNPATCATAAYTPVPSTESWHYSLGHWVEDDPAVGDGAFSSAGAFGFYPWIDSTKRYYGVVSRLDASGNAGYPSAQCGRLVRKAWLTGVAQ